MLKEAFNQGFDSALAKYALEKDAGFFKNLAAGGALAATMAGGGGAAMAKPPMHRAPAPAPMMQKAPVRAVDPTMAALQARGAQMRAQGMTNAPMPASQQLSPQRSQQVLDRSNAEEEAMFKALGQ